MGIWIQCALCFFNVLLISAFELPHGAYGGNIRNRRQAGYVYDRPSISFNLPSTTVSTTQATNVDRVSAQQMYYTYPAPTGGGTVNVGSTSSGSAGSTSTATSSVGYSYGGVTLNDKSGGSINSGGSVGNVEYSSSGSTRTSGSGSLSGYNYSISQGASGETGYTYNNQNVLSESSGVSSGGSGAAETSGYNYGGTQNTVSGSSGITSDQAGATGYSYSGVKETETRGTSDTSGYSYTSVSNDGASIGNSQSSNSASYSYNTAQNSGSTGTQAITTSVSSGYIPPILTGVSTNAPEYLPPVTSGNGLVSVSTNIQSGIGSSAVMLSDAYLPPDTSVNTAQRPSVTQTTVTSAPAPISGYLTPNTVSQVRNTQTQVTSSVVSSKPTSNYLAPNYQSNQAQRTEIPFRPTSNYLAPTSQTSNTQISQGQRIVTSSRPNSNYLVPNTASQVSIQNNQAQVSVTSTTSVQSPNQDYLPAVSTSSENANKGTITKPASSYLPPKYK